MANRLETLSTSISEGVQQLNQVLAKNNLPCPSFDPGYSLSESAIGPDGQTAVWGVASAALELLELLTDPKDWPIAYSAWSPSFVYDVCQRFSIAEKVPIDGDVSYAELSQATGVNEDALTRILRYGVLHRIFQEKRPGFISHSAISELLISKDNPSREFTEMAKNHSEPTWRRMAEALEKWPSATAPNETAFMLAEGSDDPDFLTAMAKTPERATRFSSVMSLLANSENLANDYPFAELGSGILVDMGGNRGRAAFQIAQANPELHIIVQDIPAVIEGAQQREGVKVSFMTHSFFKEQPVRGADAYMIRWCLHDWSDPWCLKILRALVPALKDGSKLLVIESVLPPFGTVPIAVERRMRGFDMAMLAFMNAKERTMEDWRNLFATADTRFKLQKVVPLQNSILSVLEFVWTSNP